MTKTKHTHTQFHCLLINECKKANIKSKQEKEKIWIGKLMQVVLM